MPKFKFYDEDHWRSLHHFFDFAEESADKDFEEFEYGFIAAVFLLFATKNLREEFNGSISPSRIFFTSFDSLDNQDLNSSENALVGLAANLYSGLTNGTSFQDIAMIEDPELLNIAFQSILFKSGKIEKELIYDSIENPFDDNEEEVEEMFTYESLQEILEEQEFTDINYMTFGSAEMGDNALLFKCKYQKYSPAIFFVKMTNNSPINEVDLAMFVTNSENLPEMISGDRFYCDENNFIEFFKMSIKRQIENLLRK